MMHYDIIERPWRRRRRREITRSDITPRHCCVEHATRRSTRQMAHAELRTRRHVGVVSRGALRRRSHLRRGLHDRLGIDMAGYRPASRG